MSYRRDRGAAEEVARAILWLASDEGPPTAPATVIDVSGGR